MLDVLEAALAEIEAHVHAAGWDRGPTLFALVSVGRFTADDPVTARRLGIDTLPPDALTPVEQDDLPDQPLDELLAGIAWPDSVAGCAVTQEIVILPPSAESTLTDADAASRAADHPERREARLAAGVLRDGSNAALLRMRGTGPAGDGHGSAGPDDGAEPAGGAGDDLLTGPDLAPNLVAALQATLR
ncbi:hypothetical protein SAMN05443575_0953 [Jatrophihabitans endophyticus]|uniref:Uncharacterized protein n=1 Tax=Jatrophihabitans endophyticus TaxID=1206085 RepID=A0A1M5ENZ4_9ACTN|nr:PPA1309 family protein [Jatrophihabitans endophyticus]SHF80935.1 hypothetical protein SAMN05443575_0953 [Jatrophihabitans endophyticus]